MSPNQSHAPELVGARGEATMSLEGATRLRTDTQKATPSLENQPMYIARVAFGSNFMFTSPTSSNSSISRSVNPRWCSLIFK